MAAAALQVAAAQWAPAAAEAAGMRPALVLGAWALQLKEMERRSVNAMAAAP